MTLVPACAVGAGDAGAGFASGGAGSGASAANSAVDTTGTDEATSSGTAADESAGEEGSGTTVDAPVSDTGDDTGTTDGLGGDSSTGSSSDGATDSSSLESSSSESSSDSSSSTTSMGTSCAAGMGDCDNDGSCETDLTTLGDCGGCGNDCNLTGATATACVSGMCEVTLEISDPALVDDAYVADDQTSVAFGATDPERLQADGMDPVQRSYVRADLSMIPGGASITTATLRLWGFSSGDEVSAHIAQNTWDEDLVTWANQPSAEGATLSSADVPGNGAVNYAITSAVQAWVDGTKANHGLRLSMDGVFGWDGGQWRSSEYAADPTQRPMFIVELSY